MIKAELRKLRALPATRQMIEKAESGKYKTLARVQNLNGYVKIAIFFPRELKKGIKTPTYETFINVEGKEFITRELDENGTEVSWSTAMIDNLKLMPWEAIWREKYFINADAKRTLKRMEVMKRQDKTGLRRLQQWQQEIRENDIRMKEMREVAPWDADMKLVPKEPKGLLEWMRRHVCRETFIFYSYEKRGANYGYCSKCKSIVNIKDPKHNKRARGPRCGEEALFKANGMIKTLSTDTYNAECIQKIKGGIVIRRFIQRQYYKGRDFRNPIIQMKEVERDLILDGQKPKRYEFAMYKNKYKRWCLDKNFITQRRTYYWSQRTKLYMRNWAAVSKSRIFQKSSINLWEELPTDVTNFIEIERGNPAIEMLAKIGMFRLAKNIINARYDNTLLKQDETQLTKMLKIDNARLKRLKEMDANITSLRWMQMEKMQNTVWPDEMIRDFGEAGIGTSELGFLEIKISYVKCWNYLKKQSELMNESIRQAMTTWRDYTYMADQMKMDTKNEQIAKPKDIKAAHDRLVIINKTKGMEKQAAEIEKKWKKVNKQLKKLKKYEFQSGEYCIVAPDKVVDIVKEGIILGHCVHSCDYYFERIQTDESYLFFLRKKSSPDMPWYTLEVEPSGNIRQKRTTGDRQNADLDKATIFLKKWQQYFVSKLTEEEKELGKKADELRKKNYKKLRKDGNKVWHGPLAGQLLADVLEADFMAVI